MTTPTLGDYCHCPRNQDIRLWVFRHPSLAAEWLITTLANAVDTARDTSIVTVCCLTCPADPIVLPPLVKLLSRGRRPHRRFRGG
jgi:hypothetical protein